MDLVINGGILKVQSNNITILANEASLPDDVMESEIEKSIKMAEEKLASKLDPKELIQLEKQIRYQKMKRELMNA